MKAASSRLCKWELAGFAIDMFSLFLSACNVALAGAKEPSRRACFNVQAQQWYDFFINFMLGKPTGKAAVLTCLESIS